MKHKANIIIHREPDEHAFASPSKFEVLESCPYYAKCSALKKQEPSAAAERGRMLHEAVYNDEVYATLSDEDRAEVDKARETDIIPYDDEGFTIEFERRVEVKDEDGKTVTFGTIDQLVYPDDMEYMLIIDRKFGRIPVTPAPDNRQMYGYALGVFQDFGACRLIGARISQPSVGTNDAVAEFTRDEDYEKLYAYVTEVVSRAENATPSDANPSADNCRWCNKEACEACNEAVTESLEASGTSLPVCKPEDFSGEPTPLMVARGDEFLRQVEVAEAWIARAKAKVKDYILRAGGSEHYFVVGGKSSKTTDWEAVCKECGVPDEVVEKHTVVKMGTPFVKRNKKK